TTCIFTGIVGYGFVPAAYCMDNGDLPLRVEFLREPPVAAATNHWAALDLGSNSFHLLIAKPVGGSFIVVERLKEKVQLLGGFSKGTIQADAQQRGLACLARFAQRLRPIPLNRIQVMGTYALRQAENAREFLRQAEAILQLPIAVISGEQEGRLIYRAVNHHVAPATPQSPACQCVIDIGGGSTEIAVGIGGQVEAVMSVDLGCVAYKDRYFADSDSQSEAYRRAKAEAIATLAAAFARHPELAQALRKHPTEQAWFGTSGTIQSIATVLNANGWTRDTITREAIARLEEAIVEDRWVLHAGLPGLAPDRADIFAGGAAILSACCEVLDVPVLEDVDVSLLQGMMCTALMTNLEPKMDLREDSVAQLSRRFAIDLAHAQRVEACAVTLFQQASSWWDPIRAENPAVAEDYLQLLRWAALLHEVGAHISHRHYHRHGGYIIKHTQMPGFTELHKSMLALLVRGHRRSMPGLAFQTFSHDVAAVLLRLVALLRIAVILQRSRTDDDAPAPQLRVTDAQLQLACGGHWLAQHPLSARELEVEQQQLATAGLQFIFS
ncbi:MAG: Ppx/GppA phosphatase family protein, partial [Pseudomonadota bacterium]